MTTLPIENCYWVVPGKLLAGKYPRDKGEESSRIKINALLRSGIKVYVHWLGRCRRTGLIIGCWLIHQGLKGPEALVRL